MRVLIADDEPVIADTLALIFRSRHMEAIAVYSGESAVRVAQQWKPDFLICDIVMGGINGFQVGAYVREHLPDCSVLLFSGHAATADMKPYGADDREQFDILTKPVHPRVLLDYVKTHTHCTLPN